MTDNFGRQIGLSDDELAHLDRIAQLWPDSPVEAVSEPIERPLAPAKGIAYGCAGVLLLAVAVALVCVGLAATSTPPPNRPASTTTSGATT